MEDYLEAIAVLKKTQRVARVKDISQMLNVESPSVTSALNTLAKNGLVIHERYGYVDLTREGEKLAGNVQKRHELLCKFLIEILHIDPKTAEEDACKMEHSLSPVTSERLTKFIKFVESCPTEGGPDWIKSFDHYLKTGCRRKCKVRQLKQESLSKE